MAASHLISVDFGGTKILTALIDETNQIIARIKIATDVNAGLDSMVQSVAQSVKQIIAENNLQPEQVKAVCMGVPGTVNPNTGEIAVAPNLGIKNFNIKEALEKEIPIKVLIENDVNLAGLGIQKFEMGSDVKNMLVIFIGTGIGSALFFDRKIYRGSSFYAGEIGHMLVEGKGNFASGKTESTLELLASRTAIVREIKAGLKKGKKSVLKEYKSPKKQIKSKILSDALAMNDPLVVKQINKACKTIGTVLGSVTTLLNIDTIVLGGGVIEAMHEYMTPRIKEAFSKAVLKSPGECVNIFETKLGDDSAIYGGIALAEEFLGN